MTAIHKVASALVALAFLAACSPRLEPADSVPRPADVMETASGVVRVVGSAPVNTQVVLESSDGRRLRLVGDFRDELSRLAGITVSVSGRGAAATDPLADWEIEVASYEIGMVEGRGVMVGEIVQVERGEAQLRTGNGDIVLLTGIPNEFRVGQKVWVQGPATVVVQSFGVLRQ